MATEDETVNEEKVLSEGTTPAGGDTSEQPTQEHMIPKSRFDEVNAKLRELIAAQEKADKATAAAQQKALEEQNEFKTLYEQAQATINELKPVQVKYDAYLNTATESNAKRIESLPEHLKAIVPDYDDPLKLASWLDSSASLLQEAKPKAPNLNAGASSNGTQPKGISEAEARELAAIYGVDSKYLLNT
ncbi:MAG: hypothetical protein GY927_03895 [bacterium]|nr:hypothetical protein [bacterium]